MHTRCGTHLFQHSTAIYPRDQPVSSCDLYVVILLCVVITVPGTVTNVRAYLYKPTRDADNLTALVLWDEPDFVVSNYSVSVFENGVELFPRVSCKYMHTMSSLCHECVIYSQPEVQKLFQPDMILYQSPNADTHYTLSARDFENRVKYFLTPGITYKLQVSQKCLQCSEK